MSRPVTRHGYDDGNDRWRIAQAAPSAALTNIVDRYMWWSEETHSFTTRRELAATTGVFIVNLGSTIEIVDAQGDLHRLAAGQGFVGGMAQATSLSRSTGAMEGIHIHLPTMHLARILGIPIGEITDRVVDFEAVCGTAARTLGARMLEVKTLEAQWQLLDGFIERQLCDAAAPDRTTPHLLTRLQRGERVQALADDLGWSRKRLARHFHDATGMLPRAFAGLARFERFSRMLVADPSASLAGIAATLGYADQAHLTREVGRYAEMTPSELRARLIPQGGGVRD